MKLRFSLAVLLLTFAAVLFAATPARPLASGQQATAKSAPKSAAEQELLPFFDDAAQKTLNLAQATPAEKYGWRPGEGVRSIGEVYVHIANANHLLLAFARGEAPGHDQLMKQIQEYSAREKTLTGKDAIIAYLKESNEQVRQAISHSSAADLDRPVKMFGETTTRGAFVALIGHIHEHLGQSIAYARMNGVVPPWSRPQSAKAESGL